MRFDNRSLTRRQLALLKLAFFLLAILFLVVASPFMMCFSLLKIQEKKRRY